MNQTHEIRTPRGAVIQVGKARCKLEWEPGFGSDWSGRYNKAQKYLDSEILRHCAPYAPLRTSMLIKSGSLGTQIGSGTVAWIAPYAKLQYYHPRRPGSSTGPLRGPKWFERMKADHGQQIIAGAKKFMGG